MKESKDGKVDLSEDEPAAVEALVNYLYDKIIEFEVSPVTARM